MMKKILMPLVAILLLATNTQAHEGMWMLNKLKQVNEAEMRKLGFELTAEDIYAINKSSMKDAVVRMGRGFCTGEMVSAEGLLFTNHHCGYDAIQGFSTVEHDYLTDGFWAMSRDKELNVEGLTVSYLQEIIDVTNEVMAEVGADLSEMDREAKIEEIGARLVDERVGESGLEGNFKTMFEGNEFYIFTYKTYRDVRLVGAPPSSVGKFGGDTDNWMWPRHTGDFSMFRVYADANNEPADYSADNKPFKPAWHLPVSLKGVKEGDFAMVMGYPGSTDRYLSSYGVKLALDVEQPARVKIRGEKLEIMKQYMAADDATRIAYATKYAQISNYWKYFIGQQRGLKRLKVYDKKKAQEDELMAWVEKDPARKKEYGDITKNLADGYGERAKFEKATTYMQEAAFGSEAVVLGFRLFGLKRQLETDPKDTEKVNAAVAAARAAAEEHFAEYNKDIDQEVTAAMFNLIMNNVAADLQPTIMEEVKKKYKGNVNAWVMKMFASSVLTDKDKLNAFLDKPSLKVLQKDMVMKTTESCLNHYRGVLGPAIDASSENIDRGYRLMVKAMQEKDPEKQWYPNANSTTRLSYGVVDDYFPADAVHYDYVCTHKGILEKEDNTDDEFMVPNKLHDLLMRKDFGQYADENGDLVVCFISNNDITGGNSGSPVINGSGELIGIAFDGNWEAMSGDIAFENELQRTISVDIRYVLFIIDKYAGASHLVNEMTLVRHGDRKEEAKTTPTDEKAKPVLEKMN